jgi:sugar phosphate isomerase/epimerase
LGVKTVVTFSGCPGDSENSKYPNWPVSPWPLDFQEVLEFQWQKKLIPYWKEIDRFAADNGVNVALELHGGFSVHTPATMIRLCDEIGATNVGANVDPSHLWWQGIDPSMAIRHIGEAGCLYYFHAKDTKIEQKNVDYYGLTDMQSYANVQTRAWQFRTIGFGHGIDEWANILSTLRLMGYDGYVSIEHEDALMSSDEGLNKAIENIRTLLMEEPASIPKMFSK